MYLCIHIYMCVCVYSHNKCCPYVMWKFMKYFKGVRLIHVSRFSENT